MWEAELGLRAFHSEGCELLEAGKPEVLNCHRTLNLVNGDLQPQPSELPGTPSRPTLHGAGCPTSAPSPGCPGWARRARRGFGGLCALPGSSESSVPRSTEALGSLREESTHALRLF